MPLQYRRGFFSLFVYVIIILNKFGVLAMIIRVSEKIKKDVNAEYGSFIDKYIDKIPAEHSVIYLYCVKKAAVSDITAKEAAEALQKDEKDILALFNYFALLDIASIKGDTILINGIPTEKVASPYMNRPDTDIEEVKYAAKANPEIRSLLTEASKYLGRMLSGNDMTTIYSFYDFYKLPIDVILYLFEYCSAQNKSRLSYHEKIALDWAENNIDTIEKAKLRVKAFDADLNAILKTMGIAGRTVTPAENSLIKKWKNEYGFTMDMIIFACEKKPSFNYADAVLSNWHDKGIKTLEEAKKEDEKYASQRKKESEPKKSKNQFTGFANQRKYDYDALEKMIFNKYNKPTEDK